MLCTKCGAKSDDGSVFCSYCGSQLIENNNNDSTILNENKVNAVNTTNSNIINPNDKYANRVYWISLILAILSAFFMIGWIWVICISVLLFSWIKKAKQSNLVKKANNANIFTIVFIVLQIINNIYFIYKHLS